jgi:hypothetical protein
MTHRTRTLLADHEHADLHRAGRSSGKTAMTDRELIGEGKLGEVCGRCGFAVLLPDAIQAMHARQGIFKTIVGMGVGKPTSRESRVDPLCPTPRYG